MAPDTEMTAARMSLLTDSPLSVMRENVNRKNMRGLNIFVNRRQQRSGNQNF